jgi:hypothetical protein
VDCYLETEALVLLIEGKRNEPLSSATEWFPQRDQVVRNVEVAREVARQTGKNYAVLLCAEQLIELGPSRFEESLPHLASGERDELRSHYAGCVTWGTIVANLCPEFKLPEKVDSTVPSILRARSGRCE